VAIVPDHRRNASVSARRRGTARGAPLATFELPMMHRPFPLLLILTVAIAFISTAVHASDVAVPFPHVRAADSQMRALIDDAIASSATVRVLVERITASDVVVFVVCEHDPAVKASGRLNFMVSAGGTRYVVIRLKPKRRAAAIAMLGHELQHAAEIADTPSIVDEQSLGREYERIGYRSHASHGGLAFDTKAAVDIGRRVAEELKSAAPIVGRALPAAPGGPDKVRPTISD
jgi:hypothetical protein